MASLTNFLNVNKEFVTTILILLIIFYLINFYRRVFTLPKGPFPIPVFGNLLQLRGTKVNTFVTFANLHKKYGSVYTFWFGSNPFVFIDDFELLKEAFNSKNNEFMGRPKIALRELITQNKGVDVVFSDHGPAWASLRRVGHAAVRKYAVTDKFSTLVTDCVDETVAIMKKNDGINNPFDPKTYIYLTVFNIIASSVFGKRYSIDDSEFLYFKDNFETLIEDIDQITVADLIPALKPLYYMRLRRVMNKIKDISMFVQKKYSDHLNDYCDEIIRDFSDALIHSKEEALKEGKESASYLIDANLALLSVNLFFAGSNTTQFTVRWILLLMGNFPEMQKRMRKEIEDKIGDRMPVYDDKSKCHYVNAFISECLRFRLITPMGVPHRTMCDTKIGNHFIPEDTAIFGFNYLILHNPKYWKSPESFDPMRFIQSDGQYLTTKPQTFVPFGIGRRVCLGEKLALTDLFMITVRLLQDTSGLMITLPDGPGSADLEPDPNIANFCVPKPFKIILKD